MASLAPHVSRTVKEYAPHGFSIYQDVCIPLGFLSATSSDIPLIYAEDSDYYIEKLSICAGVAQPVHGSNYWDMSIKNAGTAGTGTAELFVWNNDSGDINTPLVKNVFLEVPFEDGANQLLADGESLKVTFTKNGSAASAHFTLQIRYRRKA